MLAEKVHAADLSQAAGPVGMRQNMAPDSAANSHIILPGFNPDPSILRVGDDYYVATSTFEWFPGVQIFHSRDLKDWRLVARPLNRADLLEMAGVPDSGGVWAPALSHADGKFWLAYTIVRRRDGRFKDTHNYLTSCETIDGRWSERVALNSSGFDPSLFHDDDGRKYLVNMMWDHRPDRTPFGGILLQEYDPAARRLVGPVRTISTGSAIGLTEGPHLYRKFGRYYLMTAEGGTGYDHAVTLARADRIEGPYTYDPAGPIVSARATPDAPLQRCGHGSLVETRDGQAFVAHLCTRPLPGTRRSPMGRETALCAVAWTDDGWLRAIPSATPPVPPRPQSKYYSFATDWLYDDFQWLRRADPSALFSLRADPDALTLYGAESLGSQFDQALVARRLTAVGCVAETEIAFHPRSPQQMAGLVCYYNGIKYHYLFVGYDKAVGRHLGIMSCAADETRTERLPLQDSPVPLPASGPVRLRALITGGELRFSWGLPDGAWQGIGPVLDASALSDETGPGDGANFTGTFVGICAQDLTGQRLPARVPWFRYDEHPKAIRDAQ